MSRYHIFKRHGIWYLSQRDYMHPDAVWAEIGPTLKGVLWD